MLVLHDMEDLDYSEVAEVTGVKEATVRVRVHRARLFVRKELWKRTLPQAENVSRSARSQAGKPPSCRALFAKLSDYLDGALKDDFCTEMQRRLRDCPPCIAFLASLEETVARCRAFRPATHSALSVTLRRELMTKYDKARTALAAATV
jgi:anti-sigma factor RsiW